MTLQENLRFSMMCRSDLQQSFQRSKPREATVSEANQPEPDPDDGTKKPDEPSPAEQAQDEQARQEETGQESPS
jgi:hypothetical protein